MTPIKVNIFEYGTEGDARFVQTTPREALWVACDSGRAVLVCGNEVRQVPYEAIRVSEYVENDVAGRGGFTPGTPLEVGDTITLNREPYKILATGTAGGVRKRRRKRAPAPRGPRANQWIPPKSE